MKIIELLLGALKNTFKYHKLKIASVFAFFILFVFLLFPYEDLSDLATAKVLEWTNKQVYLEFEDLNLSLLPVIGVKLSDVKVDAAQFPTFSAASLKASPAIGALITGSLGFTLDAKKFLGGDLELKLAEGKKIKKDKPQRFQNINLEFKDASLNQILPLLKPDLSADGQINLDISGSVDPQMRAQPDVELNIDSNKFHSRPFAVDAGGGMTFPIPELKFKKVNIKGRLVGSELAIEKCELGAPQDPLYIKLKGKINLDLRKTASGVAPQWGSYDLQAIIDVSKTQEDEALFKTLNAFYGTKTKEQTDRGSKYLMKISGSSFMSTPNVNKAQPF